MKKLDTWNSWSSWSSPVGLGVFFLTTALGAAIALYALLNLIGAVLGAVHPQSASGSISPEEMQQLEAQQQMGAPSGAGVQQ